MVHSETATEAPEGQAPAYSRILLFDIDNTLLWTGGAGGTAMSVAFRRMFGIENGFARVEFNGRTDRYILCEALRQHRISGSVEDHLREFRHRYLATLGESLREKQGKLMPGFPELLEALSAIPHVGLGLATGNFSEGGRIKLGYYGLAQYFSAGGFGDESEDRNDVVKAAIDKCNDGSCPDVWVVGDTPYDVSSALANGATAVGVATGRHSVEELRLAGAHHVFRDFSDWRSAASFLAWSGVEFTSEESSGNNGR